MSMKEVREAAGKAWDKAKTLGETAMQSAENAFDKGVRKVEDQIEKHGQDFLKVKEVIGKADEAIKYGETLILGLHTIKSTQIDANREVDFRLREIDALADIQSAPNASIKQKLVAQREMKRMLSEGAQIRTPLELASMAKANYEQADRNLSVGGRVEQAAESFKSKIDGRRSQQGEAGGNESSGPKVKKG